MKTLDFVMPAEQMKSLTGINCVIRCVAEDGVYYTMCVGVTEHEYAFTWVKEKRKADLYNEVLANAILDKLNRPANVSLEKLER